MTMPTLFIQRAHDEVMADDGPTLPDRPRRRTFTAEYKLAIVEAYDACVGDGDKGALLRREGLYYSHIVEWRRARYAAARSGLAGPRRAGVDGALPRRPVSCACRRGAGAPRSGPGAGL